MTAGTDVTQIVTRYEAYNGLQSMADHPRFVGPPASRTNEAGSSLSARAGGTPHSKRPIERLAPHHRRMIARTYQGNRKNT
jgi:hypothetical protein